MSAEQRADSFAPAYVYVKWVGSISIPVNGNATLNVPPPVEIKGNVFEYVQTTNTLRIKAKGVFGSFVFASINTFASGVIDVLMRSFAPMHEFSVGSCPYLGITLSTFLVGGVRFVDIPAPVDYYIHVINNSAFANITLTEVSVWLTYLGRR